MAQKDRHPDMSKSAATSVGLSQIKLLIALDALLREGSVSAAASSLGIQVSALSRMLQELRDHYGDPILVRTGRGMRPTPFAETLRPKVRAFSIETEMLLSPGGDRPAPETSQQVGSEWHGKGIVAPLPLGVTHADHLDAAPTPNGKARRLAAIGDNAEPHRRLARYIATTAPGPGQSRPLIFAEARDAMSIILQGQGDPIQIGALLMTINYRGPTASELAGFSDAIRNSIKGISSRTVRPDLDWPAYVSPRMQASPWFIHAAKLVAMAGYTVLMHGHFGGGPDSGKLETAAGDADIPVCLSVGDVEAALLEGGIAYMPIGAIAPQVQSLLGLYQKFEMRNPVNAAVNLINPLSAYASVVGASQSSRRDLYRDAAVELELANVAVIGSTRDIAELTPDKPVKIFRLADGQPIDLLVPASKTGRAGTTGMLTQREYWRAVWSGAARDPRAEAVILHTAATALLSLSGHVETRFEDCLAKASDLWVRRKQEKTLKMEQRSFAGGRARPFLAGLMLLFLAFLPNLAEAQQKGARPNGLGAFEGKNQINEMHGNWKMTCGINDMRKICVIAQPLSRPGKTGSEATIELTPLGEKRLQAVVTLPFTVNVKDGVRIAVDQGEPSALLPIQGCSAYGCHAVAEVHGAFLTEMRHGAELHLLTSGNAGTADAVFHADLEGLAAANRRAVRLSQ